MRTGLVVLLIVFIVHQYWHPPVSIDLLAERGRQCSETELSPQPGTKTPAPRQANGLVPRSWLRVTAPWYERAAREANRLDEPRDKTAARRLVDCLITVMKSPRASGTGPGFEHWLLSIGQIPRLEGVTGAMVGLFHYAYERSRSGAYEEAALVAGAVSSSANPDAASRAKALSLLDDISGRSPFVRRIRYLIDDFTREATEPVNLALLAVPELAPAARPLEVSQTARWELGAMASAAGTRWELGAMASAGSTEAIRRALSESEQALLRDLNEARKVRHLYAPGAQWLAGNISDLRPGTRRVYFKVFRSEEGITASTNKMGEIALSPAGTDDEVLRLFHHERVHAALSPHVPSVPLVPFFKDLADYRASMKQWAYHHLSSLRYLEEAMAEMFAQVKMRGSTPGAIWKGIRYPLDHPFYDIHFLPGSAVFGVTKHFQLGIPLEIAGFAGGIYGGYRAADGFTCKVCP